VDSSNWGLIHGYVKLRTNGSFNEADQEYDKTLEEVASKAEAIRSKGYTLITGYWEDYNFQVGRYGNRYDGPEQPGGYYPIPRRSSKACRTCPRPTASLSPALRTTKTSTTFSRSAGRPLRRTSA